MAGLGHLSFMGPRGGRCRSLYQSHKGRVGTQQRLGTGSLERGAACWCHSARLLDLQEVEDDGEGGSATGSTGVSGRLVQAPDLGESTPCPARRTAFGAMVLGRAPYEVSDEVKRGPRMGLRCPCECTSR